MTIQLRNNKLPLNERPMLRRLSLPAPGARPTRARWRGSRWARGAPQAARLTTEELVSHVMAKRSLNTSHKRLLRTVTKRVGACLRHYRNKGVLRSEKAAGGRVMWAGA